jgi:hypothetical protein
MSKLQALRRGRGEKIHLHRLADNYVTNAKPHEFTSHFRSACSNSCSNFKSRDEKKIRRSSLHEIWTLSEEEKDTD